MAASRPSLCITCGLDAGVGRSFNRMPDGRACPSCVERLLEMLPPPFPGFGHLLEERTNARIRLKKAGETERNQATSTKRTRRGRKRGPK